MSVALPDVDFEALYGAQPAGDDPYFPHHTICPEPSGFRLSFHEFDSEAGMNEAFDAAFRHFLDLEFLGTKCEDQPRGGKGDYEFGNAHGRAVCQETETSIFIAWTTAGLNVITIAYGTDRSAVTALRDVWIATASAAGATISH